MWKKFKRYSHMHSTYTNIWHILNCSIFISKLNLVMYVAIPLRTLCSFVTCLLLKIPVSKRWKQKNQAKDLEACAKSRGDLFLYSQSRKEPWNLFLLQRGSHWKCSESWTTSSHSWTFSSHFPGQNNCKHLHLSSIPFPSSYLWVVIAEACSERLSRGLGGALPPAWSPALVFISCLELNVGQLKAGSSIFHEFFSRRSKSHVQKYSQLQLLKGSLLP